MNEEMIIVWNYSDTNMHYGDTNMYHSDTNMHYSDTNMLYSYPLSCDLLPQKLCTTLSRHGEQTPT